MRFDKIPGHDPQGDYWQGYRWSNWYLLEDLVTGSAKQRWKDEARDAGAFAALGALYRFRVSRWRGLLYIGETGRPLKIRFRFHWQHYEIAASLRRSRTETRTLAVHRLMATLAKKFDGAGRFEVSWTDVSSLVRDDRKGVEAELLAAYRAVMGRNPRGQWGGEDEDAWEADPPPS